MTLPTVNVGDTVCYTPDICHARDKDFRGDHVFHFVHVKDGPIRNGRLSYKAGDVADVGKVGEFAHRDQDTHHITTHGNHVIKPAAPKFAWNATVTAVGENGKCDLRIDHPRGGCWLDYPGVPFSAEGTLHSWHLPEGA